MPTLVYIPLYNATMIAKEFTNKPTYLCVKIKSQFRLTLWGLMYFWGPEMF